MVILKRIQITGFKRENKVIEVVFSENNVSIIYGDNGCGKTTFLLLLSAVLSQDDKRLEKENVSEVAIEYACNNKNEIVIIKRSIVIQEMRFLNENKEEKLVKVKKSEGYDWHQFEKSPLSELKSMFFGVQRGVPTQF